MADTTIAPVLTDDEVEQFHELGYVLIGGVLTHVEAEHYRRAILSMVPRDLTIPTHWGANDGRLKPYHENGDQSFETPELIPLLINERLYRAACQLLGDHRLRAFDASLGITIRNATHPDAPLSQNLHLDCSVPADTDFLLTPEEVQVGGCYYLTPVEPNGGGIHVVPGGHKLVMEKARSHADGRYLYNNWKRIDLSDFPPTVEVTGDAGDFAMLHHLMPHAASHNRRPIARVAQFTRFTRIDHPHYPAKPVPEGRYNAAQLAVMTPLGRKLLCVDPW